MQVNGSVPYAKRNYIMKEVDIHDRKSKYELAGRMRIRSEGNEANESMSSLRHSNGQRAERMSQLWYAAADKNIV